MHVFTYGSLMFDTVWKRVVSGRYDSHPAFVLGYERRQVRGEVYPALVRGSAASRVDGVLYLDVSDTDLEALDDFESEGEAYHRITVPAMVSGRPTCEAGTYLYHDESLTEPTPWDPEQFEQVGLPRFIATYCRDRGRG